MSFKFKIGDIVRVKKDEIRMISGYTYLKAGEVGEIKLIYMKSSTCNRIKIKRDNPCNDMGSLYVDESNLELVNTTTLQDSYYQQTHPTDFTMPSIDPDKMDTYTMEYFADTPNAKAACSHKWAAYTGIREQFEFCTICDEKRY